MRLIDFFDKGAALFPDVPMLIEDDVSLTYAQVRAITERTAGALLAQGLGADTPVATLAPNSAMAIAAHYGIYRAGCPWAPLNARNAVEQHIACLHATGAEWLFFHSGFEAVAAQLRDAVPGLRGMTCLDRASPLAPALLDWIAAHDPARIDREWTDQDVCGIFCTSGTTGQPKAVMHNHRAMEATIASLQIVMPYDTRPVNLVAAPFTHAGGRIMDALLPLGGTQLILAEADPLAILSAIERHRVTTMFLPPTLIYMLLAHPRAREFDYSSLRYVIYGAAPMSVGKLREAIDLFGADFVQVYGQTEVLMTLACLTPQDHRRALADPAAATLLQSVGRAGPLNQVAIMDDTGQLLPPGEAGEIVARGPIVMAGYRDPEKTRAVQHEGWHRTGDIGLIDVDGYVYLKDRKDDMIISGGFNVYPGEVEQVIWADPAIRDCAVIGIPDEKWGEAVTAFVEVKPDATLDKAGLIASCKARLGSVKTPKAIVVVDALPRSPVGKVLKRELRARYAAPSAGLRMGENA